MLFRSEQLSVAEGDVFFVGAGHEIRLEAAVAGRDSLVVHRAFVEAK